MPKETLLSVAQIARAIDTPESTVHYWKHRFAQHLPSRGRGRQMRFTDQAVEVFTLIRDWMRAGNPVETIADELAEHFPLHPARPEAVPQAPGMGSAEAAERMGLEMARALTHGLLTGVSQGAGGAELDKGARDTLDQLTAKVDSLGAETAALRDKIAVMEAELVRLRKDRRELERYLLDKIEKMNT